MSSWTLFFLCVGITFLTIQLFRIIELIERPNDRRRSRHSSALR